ncbi:hypothetical protein [Natrarchaeobaculum aegyptiacum]
MALADDERPTEMAVEGLTPVALRYFFEERFRGQPKYRGNILGRIDASAIDFSTFEENYREAIFDLVSYSRRP